MKTGAKLDLHCDRALPPASLLRRRGTAFPALFLGLLLVVPFRLCADAQSYPVSWDAVPGAGGYLVEVKNPDDRTVLSRTVNDNRIELNLSPGSYFFRVTTLNRFMRNESSTHWIAFRVSASKPPDILAITPDTLLTGKAQSLTLKVDNLSRDGTASIVSPSGARIPVRMDRPSTSNLRIQLPPLTEAGNYSLVLTNPPNLETNVDPAFRARYPAPFISLLQPDRIQGDGAVHTLWLKGGNFSPQAAVSVSIDGKNIDLPCISREAEDLVVSLPATLGPGEYRFFVRNEPDADPVRSPIFTVVYREVIITRLDPDQFRIGSAPASLRLYGGAFSPQATVSLTVGGKTLDLPVISREPGELCVDLPSGLAPGDYPLTVYNSRDSSGVQSPLLHVIPIPRTARTGEPTKDLIVSGGWNCLIPLSRWAKIYSSSPMGADVGVDFYFTPDRVTTRESSINLGARLSGQYSSFSSDSDVYIGSSLTMYSISLAPSMEWAPAFFKLRVYCGGGVVYSRIEGGDSAGDDRSADSVDLLAMARLALDFPLLGFLRAEVAAEYRHFFFTEPLDAISLSTGLAIVFPYY
jgi:hypothetical protein